MLYFKLMTVATATFLFGFNNCAPNQMAAFRNGGLQAPKILKAQSYDDIMYEYGSTAPVQPVITYELHEVTAKVEPLTACNFGELDILEAAVACKLNIPLVLSIKDEAREQTLLRQDLNAGLTYAQVLEKLILAYSRTVQGPEVDVFICFDSDKDGKCTDEQIADLNVLTAKLAAGQAICANLAAGLVLYHKHHKFAGQGTQSTVAIKDMAADAIKDVLKNIEVQSMEEEIAGHTTLTLPLVHSDKNLCPKPAVRTDGCFAKGTKIATAKDVELPIEKLHAGDRVMLADGRTSRIQRLVAGPEAKPMVAFETADGRKIMVTNEHPMATKAGLKLAKDVMISDELKTAEGKFVLIQNISQKKYTEHVYNFELEGSGKDADHLVIADGLVSGELFLQNKMTAKTPVRGLASK